MTFSTRGGVIYLDCINYGESGYDYGEISLLDNQSSTFKRFSSVGESTSNVKTIEISVPDNATHTIYIKYTKDGSTDSGNDSLQFAVRFQ